MPEGPEVYVLAKVLKSIGFDASSIGKHLILTDAITGELFDFSFGLAGRIALRDNLQVTKINHPDLPSGDKVRIQSKYDIISKLGIDWMKGTKEDLREVVHSWISRKKQVGALLLDQTQISGIGVAWASEILHRAKIQPDLKANLLDFLNLTDSLVNAIDEVRETVKNLYLNSVDKDEKKFINSWFMNLYRVRRDVMKVYKKGTLKKVCGRDFYVSSSS